MGHLARINTQNMEDRISGVDGMCIPFLFSVSVITSTVPVCSSHQFYFLFYSNGWWGIYIVSVEKSMDTQSCRGDYSYRKCRAILSHTMRNMTIQDQSYHLLVEL